MDMPQDVKVSIISKSMDDFKSRFPYGDVVGTSPTGFGEGWGESVQIDALMPYEFFPFAGDMAATKLPCAIRVDGTRGRDGYLAERGGTTQYTSHAARMAPERAEELRDKIQNRMPNWVLSVVNL